MKPKKKPPPDNPGNLAGRRRALRERAWRQVCGGITIVVGKLDCRYEGWTTKKPPDDARKLADALYRKWLKQGKAKPAKPAKKRKPAKPAGKVEFFKFAKEK